MSSTKSPPIVEVTWCDSFSTHHWRNRDEYDAITEADVLIRTAGYLLKRGRNVVIALSVQPRETHEEQDRICSTMTIPRGMVRSIVPLAPSRKARRTR